MTLLESSAAETQCPALAEAVEGAGVAQPRILASFVEYGDFMKALRARANELQISRDALDEVSGLGARYVSKLLAPNPPRRLGIKTMSALLGALGVKLVLQEDPDAMRRFGTRHGFGKRNETVVRSGTVQFCFSQREMKRRQRKGGENSRSNLDPEEASELGRRAALVRWNAVKRSVRAPA